MLNQRGVNLDKPVDEHLAHFVIDFRLVFHVGHDGLHLLARAEVLKRRKRIFGHLVRI